MRDHTNQTNETDSDLYLPAVAPGPDFERIGDVVSDLLDLHGVVLIPDTYNE